MSELFKVGRQQAAVFQLNPPALVNGRHDNDFTIRRPEFPFPPIRGQEELITGSDFNWYCREDIEGLRLLPS